MMKKFICLFLIFLIALPATFSYVYADFLNINQNDKSISLAGNGTLENPYIITSAHELDEIRNNLSAHYKLGNDIDLTEYLSDGGEGYAKWNKEGWEPIGNPDGYGNGYFTGSFEGAYHIISGLWINRTDSDNIGLFGGVNSYNNDTCIQNLGIKIAENGISGNSNVGGLIGVYATIDKVRNCYVTGSSVSGANNVGGLIGNQDVLGTTVNCYTKTNVISEKDSPLNGNIGGLIGIASGSVIHCYASGNVKGKRCCGGLLGSLEGMATANNCYATGDVISSEDLAGGLIGYLYDGSLANSCSTGKVQGNIYVGGLVGKQGGLSGISNCYSSSSVTAASDYAGGLVGAQISPPYFQNFNSISNCYAGGSIEETKGEHFGAISGYLDEESSISKCYRYNDFTINGNKILEDDKNSTPDKINGGIITEPKPAQAPNVNITLSETENTDHPVVVQLEIMSNNEIKNVSYVKVVQKINPSNIISNGHITSADYNTDINLLLSDFDQYSELTGESENAAVIYDYYINAGYPNDNGNTITIKNNSFKVNQNGEYIICTEDINNNKTFIYIDINNINSTPINTEHPTASPNYLYDIKDLSILSISGDKLETPPENTSFIVETSVNKKKESNTKDYIFVAIYDKNGMLLNLDYVKANFAPNYDCSFGFNIPPSLGEIGEIKTFIWDKFDSLNPLAETKSISFK